MSWGEFAAAEITTAKATATTTAKTPGDQATEDENELKLGIISFIKVQLYCELKN